ncbi:MAG TPA: hypothetical protein VIO60_07400 [Rectinemataceae bacterium]
MRQSDKALSTLQSELSRLGGLSAPEIPHSIRSSAERALSPLPRGLKEAFLQVLDDKTRSQPERARDWLMAAASVLLMEYSGDPLSLEEWKELRDMVSDASGEVDLALLEYAMGLVLDHGAL